MEAVLPVINQDTKQLYSQSASLGLMQYNYTDKMFIIAYSNKEDSLPTLINYLLRNKIALVSDLPEATGMFCIRAENDVFKVYVNYFDKESEIFISDFQYALTWILIQPYNLYTKIDDKPEKLKALTEEELKAIEKLSI